MMPANLPRKETINALRKGAYAYVVETTTAITFSTPIGMFNEMILNNMSLEQSVHSRILGDLVSMFTASPYSKFRNYVWEKFNTTDESNFFKKLGSDMAVSAAFTPTYSAILAASGADYKHVLAGTAASLAMSLLTSGPYGILLDKTKEFFGIRK